MPDLNLTAAANSITKDMLLTHEKATHWGSGRLL